MRYDATIKRLPAGTLFDLKGAPDAFGDLLSPWSLTLPQTPNTVSGRGAVRVAWIGPGHWLLCAPAELESDLADRVRADPADGLRSIINISDTLVFFAIAGADRMQIMAAACPLDVHPVAFPENGATYTEVFGLKGLVIRHGEQFELAVDRSFAEMVEVCLNRVVSIAA